jgi:hypothetical protein
MIKSPLEEVSAFKTAFIQILGNYSTLMEDRAYPLTQKFILEGFDDPQILNEIRQSRPWTKIYSKAATQESKQLQLCLEPANIAHLKYFGLA